jgi:hypothetical protein
LGRPVPSADQPPGHLPAQPWLLMTGETPLRHTPGQLYVLITACSWKIVY